ncbi:MAG: hypothetical protein HFE30_05045 [Clostridiales bacterium]|nr:hypothetical protein [Clostridiales bacterium]
MTEIIVALITGGLTLIGVVISNATSNNKIQNQLQTSQAVTDTKIEELTREVRAHNGFAQKIPVLEEKIEVANHRIRDLEDKTK